MTHDEATRLLASADGPRISTRRVALTFAETDTAFVWRAISACVDHADVNARGIAILCIGHMACIHGWFPADWPDARLARARGSGGVGARARVERSGRSGHLSGAAGAPA